MSFSICCHGALELCHPVFCLLEHQCFHVGTEFLCALKQRRDITRAVSEVPAFAINSAHSMRNSSSILRILVAVKTYRAHPLEKPKVLSRPNNAAAMPSSSEAQSPFPKCNAAIPCGVWPLGVAGISSPMIGKSPATEARIQAEKRMMYEGRAFHRFALQYQFEDFPASLIT